MKFGQQLELNTFPQWAQYYVRYRQIKNHIVALFPTPSEMQREALADRDRTSRSLLGLTDPHSSSSSSRARSTADTEDNSQPESATGSASVIRMSPSPSPSNDSDEHEGTSLLRTEPLPAGLRGSSSATPAPSVAEQSRTEKLAFNVNTKSYGGLDHDDVSSDDEPSSATVPAGTRNDSAAQVAPSGERMLVQLEGISIDSKLQDERSGSSSHSPSDSRDHSPTRGLPPLPPSASASLAPPPAASSSRIPPSRRHVAAVASDGHVIVSHKRFHALAPQSHLEKLDQVCVKLMAELQKIDEFHRIMEHKIAAAYEGLKAQVAAARDGDTGDTEAIHRRMKEMRSSRGKRSSGGQSGQLTSSRSANSLSTASLSADFGGSASASHSRRNSQTIRGDKNDSPGSPLPSGDDSAREHAAAHGVGHVRYHANGRGHSHGPGYLHALRKEQHRSRSDSGNHERQLDSLPLRAAFAQLLRRATMLIHFVDINFVAIAKLLKCFEKRAMQSLKASAEGRNIGLVVHAQRVHKQMLQTLQNRSFYTSRKVDAEIVPGIYQLYADFFESGNTERAKLVLLSSLTEQEYSSNDAFWLGLKIGCILMLLGLLLFILVRPASNLVLFHEMQLFAPVYRCVGLLIVLLWLWSFLVQIWDAFGVPYVLMFQLNPRTRLTHFQLQVEAANLTIVYLLNSLLFLTHSGQIISERFSMAIYPAALFLFLLVKLFAPWRHISHWGTRVTLLQTMLHVVIAPFGKTRFLDTFVGDFLTSMVKVIVDVETALCLVATYFIMDKASVIANIGAVGKVLVPILCALPLWFRFLQCLRRYWDTTQRMPHVPNALKYLISHSVVIMAAYHPVFNDHHATSWQTYRVIWLLCCVASTLYSTWWDIVMDWGLFQKGAHWPGLRKELLYGERNVMYYYGAMVINCLLRWVWVITIIPFSFELGSEKDKSPTNILSALVSWDQIIIPVLALLELLRRFQWSIFRVEYEQVVLGTKLRVDPHLPIFLQQLAKSREEKNADEAARAMDFSVLSEVVAMAICLIVIALIAALT